jgi:ectoine hydroxylase-related dioxygenase (phytanoyl-CoA dioxygenase family)
MPYDLAAARETYAADGVVALRGALDEKALGDALAAWEWSLAHPGPASSRVRQADQDATFYNDLFNPDCLAGYRAMLETSPLPAQMAELWGSPDVWFYYEQVFLKEGGQTRRTPWHQDSSYLAIAGDDLAVCWITFDPLSPEDSLEFVRASHRGALYSASRFELGDDTAPINPGSTLPRLPDIEADRASWDIISFPTRPGDVVVFHPKMLHGGASTRPHQRRRTLTLRFFGRDAVYSPLDGRPGAPGVQGPLNPGDPYRDPRFLKLR